LIPLVALYGVGDAYLVCSLARAFQRHHNVHAVVVVKPSQKFIPEWFGLLHQTDERIVAMAEAGERALWQTYDNAIVDGAPIYVHPHFVKTPTRLDQLTIKPRVSQADMYRALMQLPPDASMEKPNGLNVMLTRDVVMITSSRSWPNMEWPFYSKLAERLRSSGREVTSNSPSWSLEELLRHCASAQEIIGPQCGVMSILLEAGIGGHKTLCIRELGPDCPYLFGLQQTMPYGHCSTFAGNDHPNVDHIRVSPQDWESRVDVIVEGCRRGWLANGDV
jgi:riboflavin biosynthesis pyrimidine reductase